MSSLSIIIPVFNNYNFTKSCLEDLVKLDSEHEFIVVDNASNDDTPNYLEKLCNQDARVKYLRNSENLGFAKACNRGYAEASAPVVMFLNNDIRVLKNHENWTKELILLGQDNLVGPTGGLIDRNANFIKEIDRVEYGNFYMSGWCLTASKKIWSRLILPQYVGPFSEEFGIAYFEDTDLGLRAAKLEIPCKIKSIPVHHYGRMTSKKIGMSQLYPIAQAIFRQKWLGKLK